MKVINMKQAIKQFLAEEEGLTTVEYAIAGSLVGAAVAARHVWLQNLPPDQVPSCGPGLDFMLDAFSTPDLDFVSRSNVLDEFLTLFPCLLWRFKAFPVWVEFQASDDEAVLGFIYLGLDSAVFDLLQVFRGGVYRLLDL